MSGWLWAWVVGGLLPMLVGQAIAPRLPTSTIGLVGTLAACSGITVLALLVALVSH
jgi:hypothetical protein